jgi:hypothetical protein
VPEQLCVVRRADQGRAVGAGGGGGVPDQVDEVASLALDDLGGDLGVVGGFAAQVAGRVGDAPEAKAPGEMLLVEF